MIDIAGIKRAVAASTALGTCSAFGDWIWARYIPDGAVVPGIVHGLLVFLLLAAVLAAAAGTRTAAMRLLPTLPLVGCVIASVFYPLAGMLGYLAALLVTWILMWLALALLQRWARGGGESTGRALGRGALAAILSGLAFWVVSGMWTAPDPSPNYVIRFLMWTFAFLPGFMALLIGQPPSRNTQP